MAKKFFLVTDASFSKKFAIYDEQKQMITGVKTNGFTDFFNIFLGWFINLPESFKFKLDNNHVNIRSEASLLSAKYEIFINYQSTVKIKKNRQNHQPQQRFSVLINNHELHFTEQNQGNYFSIMQDNQKIIVAKRGLQQLDQYSVVISDQVDPATGIAIVIAIINSYKK